MHFLKHTLEEMHQEEKNYINSLETPTTMNKEEYIKTFEELTTQMLEITKKKNADYTGDESSPFKNFTMVETMGFATTEQGFLTRITDKVMRVSSFVKHGILQVADEKVEDTLLDCANYCLLMICYLRSKR